MFVYVVYEQDLDNCVSIVKVYTDEARAKAYSDRRSNEIRSSNYEKVEVE